jgi:hypothetical protein
MARGRGHLAWHRRRLVLPDGDVLTWIVIDEPAPPRLEAFRLASSGAIHHARAVAIRAELGHPDAGLRVPDYGVTVGRSVEAGPSAKVTPSRLARSNTIVLMMLRSDCPCCSRVSARPTARVLPKSWPHTPSWASASLVSSS